MGRSASTCLSWSEADETSLCCPLVRCMFVVSVHKGGLAGNPSFVEGL